MSRATFYPYPFAGEGLELSVRTDDERVELTETTIDATSLRDSESLAVDFEVRGVPEALGWLIPEAEQKEPPVAVMVVARGVGARRREAIMLEPGADGGWHGRAHWPKSVLFGELELTARLLRTTGNSEPGFARDAGSELATSAKVVLKVDEGPLKPGGYLDIQFEDFAESADAFRRSRATALYVVDTRQDRPVLWLNAGIKELRRVLQAKGPRGHNIRVRDAVFDSIVSQGWTALVTQALARVVADLASEADVGLEVVDALPEWQQRTLHYWAPRVYPGSRDEALARLVQAAGDLSSHSDLWMRLGAAVQDHARSAYAFRGLIRLRDREGV